MKSKILLVLLFIILISGIYGLVIINIDKDIIIPDFIGEDIKSVEKFANKNKIKLNIKKEYNNKFDENKVISHATEINKNDILDIVISKGKRALELYKEAMVNEIGNIPIMMYHGIHNLRNDDTNYTGGNVDKDGYQRTVESFRNDLDMYYKKGYRMIRLIDYIDGIIDVKFGKSPIIITFDDGLENNIKVIGEDGEGNIIIDPNSAVGILEDFKNKYPDYNVTATFFVNGNLFNQPEYNDKILKWLIDNGYDIGNHSMNHVDFTKVDSNKTQYEIGELYKLLQSKIPNKYINIVALPFGSPYKKTHENFNYIIKGNVSEFEYETKAALRVGWEANYSPFDINFDPLFIKRIRAYDNNSNEFDIEKNFIMLDSNKYISDGDTEVITIPIEKKNNLNNNKNLEVITY